MGEKEFCPICMEIEIEKCGQLYPCEHKLCLLCFENFQQYQIKICPICRSSYDHIAFGHKKIYIKTQISKFFICLLIIIGSGTLTWFVRTRLCMFT